MREDALHGLVSLRRSAAGWVDRTFLETHLLQLRFHLSRLDNRLRECHRNIGEKLIERIDQGEGTVFSDEEAGRLFEEADRIRQERERILSEIDALKKGEGSAGDSGD